MLEIYKDQPRLTFIDKDGETLCIVGISAGASGFVKVSAAPEEESASVTINMFPGGKKSMISLDDGTGRERGYILADSKGLSICALDEDGNETASFPKMTT